MTTDYLKSEARRNVEELARKSYCTIRPGTIDEVRYTLLIENTVRECCRMVNEHMQGNNPYDSLLTITIKDYFGMEVNEGLEIPPCKKVGQ